MSVFEVSEIAAQVLIIELNQTFTTPFTIELNPGTYILRATWQGQLLPDRTTTITQGATTRENFYFTPPPTRKGASSSSAIQVTVKPKVLPGQEATILTLKSDSPEYFSGNSMVFSGSLLFSSDQMPLQGRTITLEQQGVTIATLVTAPDGSYSFNHFAPVVQQNTVYTYTAKFGGDP